MTGERGRTILVTGAAGHLGAEVVRDLAAAGHPVIPLDRIVPPGAAASFILDDLSCRLRLEALFGRVDAVVHCAAYPNPDAAAEEIVFAGNVATAAAVLFAAESARVRRVVYASSQSALGFASAPGVLAPDVLPVDEEHPCRPGEGYALSKWVGEKLCAMIAARSRMSVRALRFPVIWAAAGFAAHTQKRLGDPQQAAKSQWAYVDLRDAARACRLAVEDAGDDPYALFHVAAPWPFAMADPEALIAAAYGGGVPRRAGWRAGDAVFDSTKAARGLGFRARWRWTPDGIEAMEVDHALAE